MHQADEPAVQTLTHFSVAAMYLYGMFRLNCLLCHVLQTNTCIHAHPHVSYNFLKRISLLAQQLFEEIMISIKISYTHTRNAFEVHGFTRRIETQGIKFWFPEATPTIRLNLTSLHNLQFPHYSFQLFNLDLLSNKTNRSVFNLSLVPNLWVLLLCGPTTFSDLYLLCSDTVT